MLAIFIVKILHRSINRLIIDKQTNRSIVRLIDSSINKQIDRLIDRGGCARFYIIKMFVEHDAILTKEQYLDQNLHLNRKVYYAIK